MLRFMQLFEDNAKLVNKSPQMQIEGDEATIYLYDIIGWIGISAIDFVRDFAEIKEKTIHLRIHSPGGDVFEARAIATAIKQSKSKVIAHIDGQCASAATYIALSASEVEMAKGGQLMIHRAWSYDGGNSDDKREIADILDQVNESIIDDYAEKTGKTREELFQMLVGDNKNGTTMTAAMALEHGFVDRVFDGKSAENSWNLSAYSKVPDNATSGSKNAFAKDEPICYDREKLEKRLSLLEAMGA